MANDNALPSSLKRRVIEKINANKLTIIVGPTGCGKSSIIPQVLLDGIGNPILCTQPRRLAVVAVASYVAKQRGATLGEEEVGYHVGQDKTSNHDTKLVYATSGVLLEELKSRGLDALTKYKVVIIDECHERSCESDMVLTIIKEFMIAHPRSNLRLVLMSATFNHSQYISFFRGVPGCDYVDTIPIQTANSLDSFYSKVKTYYLDDIAKILARSVNAHKEDFIEFCLDMKSDPDEELTSVDKGKAFSTQLLTCIMSLANHLHEEESPGSIFLIFAPTYRQLEQIFNILGVFDHFDLHVLHSSVDVEDCLKSMEFGSTFTGRKRKVLLASAIADSSITIPNVTCVIDTCRALEVKWNVRRSQPDVATVWASQAICDQRRGRTGRTCNGNVYRLVYQSFYNNDMEEWEQPQLRFSSCRDEVLSLLSSKNKVMSDPQALMKKCIDPPPEAHVADAIEYLKKVGACREAIISRKRKLILSEHGRVISALPFTVEEAGTVVYGAKQGFLHEALALMAITSARPQPIVTAFGANESNTFNLSRYFPEVDVKDPKSVAIAHLAAYIFWYIHWNRIRRHEMKEHFNNCTRQSGDVSPSLFFGEYSLSHNDKFSYNVGSWTPELDIAHSDWCREHFINPSAVKSMSQNVEVTLKTLYRSDFDPEWLKCQALEPAWNKDLTVEKREHVFSSVYGHVMGRDLSMRTLVELQGQQTLSKGNNPVKASYACIHYLNGYCLFGDDCLNAHSPSAPRPPCRFQLRAGGCTNRNCVYSHNEERADTSSDAAHIKPMHGKFNGGALAWFCQDSSSILLLGSCGIIRSLEALGKPPGIVLGGRSILELAHFHQNRYLVNLNRSITKCAWNFPVASSSATDEENETLLRGFFHSAAAFFQSMLQTDAHLEVGLALEGSQFSKWNVMSVIQHAGFCLEWYEDFDSAIFPSYVPRYANNEPIDTLDAKFFVFRMKKAVLHDHPPRRMEIRHHTQFGMELEMSVSGHLTRDTIAKALSHDGIVVENVDSNWSDVKRTSQNWKLVDDGSLICNPSQPNCNKFELVSPVLQSEAGLHLVSKVLQRLSNVGVTVNRSMGFHVHFDVGKYSISDVIKICQLFVKYEKAIDSMLPFSRRTGSANSDKFFNSNMKLAMEVLGKNEEGVLAALGSCKSYHDIAEVMNPPKSTLQDRRYFKLNLQNLITERQSTIEFRQHSATADYDKVDAWVRFIIRFCVNAASLDKPTSFDDAPRNVDEQFEHLFKNIIRDSVLHSHYRERRHLLSVNGEGDACCPGCVTGRGCLK